MKYVILILSVLMLACSDDVVVDCDGFEGEPYLLFKPTKADTFGVFFLNPGGIGDTLFSYQGETLKVPVDMSSDTMFYELLGDSLLGKLVLAYALEQRLCETSDQLKQYFAMAQFTSKSNTTNLYTIIDGAKLPVDTASGYAGFLNQTLSDRYFEVEM